MHLAPRRLSQTQWVIVSMILGVAVGFFFPDSKAAGFHASDLQVLTTIFLRPIKMLIAPLIVSMLVVSNCLAAVLMARWEGTFDIAEHAVPVVGQDGTVLRVLAILPSGQKAKASFYS